MTNTTTSTTTNITTTSTTTRRSNTIATQLDAAYHLTSTSLKEGEIARLVSEYGYPTAQLERGVGLYKTAATAVATQDHAQGVKQTTTAVAAAAYDQLLTQCELLTEVARALFPAGSGARQSLGITGRIPRTQAGLVAFATTLYRTARTDTIIAAVLDGHRYTAALLAAEEGQIATFQDAATSQRVATAAARTATAGQAAALAALRAWVRPYRRIARAALKKTPHLRAILNV